MAKRKQQGRGRTSAVGALERIRVFGDPVLRQQTTPVIEFDARLCRLTRTMFEVMDREEGVGLAANQIGVVSRVMVWMDPDNDYEEHIYVNPLIIEASESTTCDVEGCLSIPGESMEVPRADEILVEAQDLEGNVFQAEWSGFQARVVQHEVDHLDGRLILDRTSPEERRRVLKDLRERALAVGS